MKEVELYPHQKKAVARLSNGKILTGGVGSGKSRVAMQYYFQTEWESDLIVITTAKKRDSRDWEDEASEFGIGTDPDASLGKTITVDSWNNLWRYIDRTNAFFIFDEQRLVGSGRWVKVFLKIVKNNRWILLSATPGDTWLDYIPVFVANGLYKNRTEFLREHVVYSRYSKFPKVEKYIGVGRLVKHRNDLLVDMPYEKTTVRHIETIEVPYDEQLLKKVVKERWHVYEDRPLKDVAELFSVMRKVVNSNPSRIRQVRELLSVHPKLIVFYNFNYELEILRTLVSSEPSSLLVEQSKTLSLNDSDTKPYLEMDSKPLKELSLEKDQTPTPSQTTKDIPSDTWGKSTKDDGQTPMLPHSQTKSTTDGSTTVQPLLEKSSSTLDSTVAIAEWNGHKHQPIPTTDRWVYLVQYTAGAEGWNCVETNAVCFYSLNYSYRVFEQCQGRIDRLNTLYFDLFYYVLRSTAAIDEMIWKAIKTKKFFNENSQIKKGYFGPPL